MKIIYDFSGIIGALIPLHRITLETIKDINR